MGFTSDLITGLRALLMYILPLLDIVGGRKEVSFTGDINQWMDCLRLPVSGLKNAMACDLCEKLVEIAF